MAIEDKVTRTIATYDETCQGYARNVENLSNREAEEYFTRYVKEMGNVLDLGCGSGRDAKTFSELGYRITGIDLSKKMIDVAKLNAPLAKFKCMDIRQLNFQNESFDGLWAVASLLHLPRRDVPGCLAECYRVLKTGGLIYVGVKQGRGNTFQPDKRYGKDSFKLYTLFQRQELERLMNSAGFQIVADFSADPRGSYLKHKEIRLFGRK